MMRIAGIILTLLLSFLLHVPHAIAGPKIIDLMKKVEDLQAMTTDVRARVDFTQTKTGQGTKKSEMLYYRRDSDDAFLIVILSPDVDRGNGYLRVGDNFWMYRLNTRTFQHVNRAETSGGTDAHAEDFERRKLTELYAPAKDDSGN
jgi:hypothetical protein